MEQGTVLAAVTLRRSVMEVLAQVVATEKLPPMMVMEVRVLAVVTMEVVAPNNGGGWSAGNGRQVTALNYMIRTQLIDKQDVNDLHAIVFIDLGLATGSGFFFKNELQNELGMFHCSVLDCSLLGYSLLVLLVLTNHGNESRERITDLDLGLGFLAQPI